MEDAGRIGDGRGQTDQSATRVLGVVADSAGQLHPEDKVRPCCRLVCARHTGMLLPEGVMVPRVGVARDDDHVLRVQPGVWGRMAQEVRWNKGPPWLAITEHWNYDDKKDFFGCYCWMGQGPLPIEWAAVQTGSRGLWDEVLRDAVPNYNHITGVKMVGELLPDEANRVILSGDLDHYSLAVARITYRWGDKNKALIQHALEQMGRSIEVVGATDMFRQEDDTNDLGGTARIGDDPTRSVVDADCRSWDIPNLWVCDGSGFPTVGDPALTIQTVAMRTASRIGILARRVVSVAAGEAGA